MLKKAAHVLDTLNLDDEERLLYEGQLKWLRDEEAGIDKAYARGVAAGEELLKVEKQKAEEKLEAERQKAAVEKQKAEAERQKAEVEKQKAEAERQKAEAEKRDIARKMETSGMDKKTIQQITGLENW